MSPLASSSLSGDMSSGSSKGASERQINANFIRYLVLIIMYSYIAPFLKVQSAVNSLLLAYCQNHVTIIAMPMQPVTALLKIIAFT